MLGRGTGKTERQGVLDEGVLDEGVVRRVGVGKGSRGGR